MRTYFGIHLKFSEGAFKLTMDYSLDDVSDTLVLSRAKSMPIDFLGRFTYCGSGGIRVEDMVPNNLGWIIVSQRIANLLKNSNNADDIELLALPEKATQLNRKLEGYQVLGVNRQVKCVNKEMSEILWGSDGHILSFRECVLIETDIPRELDVFLISEYAVFPVISDRLALAFAELYPTGFDFEKIRAI